ncbi:MAG TPA: thioredoxin family protein [Methanocella sp.]|nr:thioredoxin family protein [Methanocella sp.]
MVVILFGALAGCARPAEEIKDQKVAEIDAGLRTGPVFIEFGATWCDWCQLEKPVVRDLAAVYGGVRFVDVDTDVNGSLASDYFVEGIPQMDIVVKRYSNGSYLYIDPQGKVTMDRLRARIVGYHERDELEPLIQAALAAR